MLTGKYKLNICLGPSIPGFPDIKISKENPPLTKITTGDGTKKIPHTIEFFEENGVMKAIHTTPCGKQKVDNVTYSDYSAAWTAYAGSEGVEVFHFVMIMSESTDAVWGFTAGISPFFRRFTPFEGVKVG